MATLSTLTGSLEHVSVAPMELYTIDPLSDPRWEDLVASHPKASAFHQKGWLEALARTYGYEPIVLTSAPAEKRLTDGIVFCRVKSWITGTRLVSLPFADHCEPLLNDIGEFTGWMRAECNRQHWKYVELRPLSWSAHSDCPLAASRSYWFHTLDLTPPIEQIFRHFHKDSIQRRIRRAQREPLSYESGRSEQIVSDFYRLLLKTRRRHQLLPQPRAWFCNLIRYMGENVQIRLVRKDGAPIAAMLTLRHRTTVVYKYGCSDEEFHNLAGMPFLFWKLIAESKAAGAEQIDFGRSDMENDGLTTFKDRFGTARRRLTYFQYPPADNRKSTVTRDLPGVPCLFSVLPEVVLPWAGALVYRHLG